MRYRICAMLTAMLLLSNCAETTISGSGCASYEEARLSMPQDPDALPTNWLRWVVETDTRLTATCG